MQKPTIKPNNPCFSSGPCAKRPNWDASNLDISMAGRSHRAAPAKAKLNEVIQLHRELLGIPDDYLIGIVPASDTGAVEMALWSLLGERGVDVFAWESFSGDWLKDIRDELKIKDFRGFEADYGKLPDLSKADFARDVVFAWNGTTSGVRVPNGNWIDADRKGLTICDATSAVFAYEMPWDKLDVTTWSWQKVLGSEAAHGMIVMSPRAMKRLEEYKPSWPMPKIFRITKGMFSGATINTPSMLAVADCLDSLSWIKSIGGLKATIERTTANSKTIIDWANKTPWVELLAQDEDTRSITTVCLTLPSLSADEVKSIVSDLNKLDVAYDIAAYRDAPSGLRIWCGATVEQSDIAKLLPWIEWAYSNL